MTERTQRRAAERKARKAEQKKLRNQNPQAIAATQSFSNNAAPLEATASCPAFYPDGSFDPGATPGISEAQLIANRANALHSTGPKTEAGKSIASQNNFRHGLTQTDSNFTLLAFESQAAYGQLLSGLESEWHPATESENILVQRLVTHEWLRRRALNLQNRFLDQETGLIADTPNFTLYRRYEVQHERAFNKAISDLLRIRALRLREQNGFESQARKQEKHEYQIRHLQHREKMYWFKENDAQARMTLAQSKLLGVNLPDGPAFRCTCEPGSLNACPEALR